MSAKKVLLVDDSAFVRAQIGNTLSKAGYEVLEATNGKEGLDKVAANPRLSMIICDVNMPVMSGLTMLEELSKQGVVSRCPVVMLTSEAQQEFLAKAKSLGAKAWMVKPVKPALLVSAVKKIAG
jgi:two-component system, chemotaxis family, chemotaxis protein CheY